MFQSELYFCKVPDWVGGGAFGGQTVGECEHLAELVTSPWTDRGWEPDWELGKPECPF